MHRVRRHRHEPRKGSRARRITACGDDPASRARTEQERAGGEDRPLNRYITSEAYAQHQREAEKLTQDILDVDADEKRQHDNVWKKRGTLATRLKNVLRMIDTEIGAIVESRSGTAA